MTAVCSPQRRACPDEAIWRQLGDGPSVARLRIMTLARRSAGRTHPGRASPARYLAHVDGLRALAIVPVVFYHLDPELIPGGFVGVDVFFVISGYLITGVLLHDLSENRFSIARFYQRRILRILPALVVMLVAVWFAAAFLLFPHELPSVGWQLITAALFSSNFFFRGESGYFAVDSSTQPLLHTWSLAVEEQFYIFFPIILFLVYRYARSRLLVVIIAISGISLLASILVTGPYQSTAFYMLPTRAWELGAGSILAIVGGIGPLKRFGNALAALGLILVVAPMLLYRDGSPPFPGWAAAVPVLGSALLIGWGAGTAVGSVLALRPVVYIGRVSYSLYLWHWPVIVFWKTATGPTLDLLEVIAIGAASLLLAVISTELIERPFRTPRARAVSPRWVISLGVTAVVGVASLGALHVGAVASMMPQSPTAQFVNYRETPDYLDQFRTGTCLVAQSEGGDTPLDQATCTRIDAEKQNVLVMGDSHAAQYWRAISEAFPDSNVMQATASGCRPLLDSPGGSRCIAVRDWTYEELLATGSIDTVIIAGRWSRGDIEYVVPTLRHLQTVTTQVILIGPTVEYEGDFPLLLARSEQRHVPLDFPEILKPGRDEVNELMRDAAAEVGVRYVDVLSAECADGVCLTRAPDGTPLQFDYGHLTLAASRYVLDLATNSFAGWDL